MSSIQAIDCSQKQSNARPLVVVAAPSRVALRDLMGGRLAETLASRYRIRYLTRAGSAADYANLGEVRTVAEDSWWRRLAYNTAKGLIHFARNRDRVSKRDHALHRGFFGVSPRQRALIRVIADLGIAGPVGQALRTLLRATAPRLVHAADRPVAVLVFTSIESAFADDVVRAARQHGTVTLAFQANWDVLATKTLIERPDYLAVWGEQSYLTAHHLHAYPSDRIFVTGCPRFDSYGLPIARGAARQLLGLPRDRKILLYCGSSIPFDDIAAVETVRDACGACAGERPPLVLYRPHPEPQPRVRESAFTPSPQRLELAPSEAPGCTSDTFDRTLLAAVDGIVTPFSTMALEAACMGRPVLALGYDDANHANYPWSYVAFESHLQMLRHSEWCLVCDDKSALPSLTRALLLRVDDDRIAAEARASATFAVRQGQRSAAERLADALDDVIGTRGADDSRARATAKPVDYAAAGTGPARDKDL